jgi:hypothetical protein
MKNIIYVTVKEVSASGVAFSNITYFCDESKSKTKNKMKMLQKSVCTNATIGSDYAKKVNRILDKEGKEIDFVARPMKGKKYVVDGAPVVTDIATETKHYLVFIVEGHSKPQTQLFLNNKKVDRKDVWNEDYITTAGLKPNAVAGRGQINEENNFFFRTLDFTNLLGYNMNGNIYLVQG